MAKARIVIAEADRHVAGVLSWLLLEQGFDATTAHPAAAVDQTLRWMTPDLLLIDGDDPELAAIVKRIIPDARIEVTSAGERDIAGLTASVSDRSLEVEVGYKRRFTPLEVGVRAQMGVARARAGLPPLPG